MTRAYPRKDGTVVVGDTTYPSLEAAREVDPTVYLAKPRMSSGSPQDIPRESASGLEKKAEEAPKPLGVGEADLETLRYVLEELTIEYFIHGEPSVKDVKKALDRIYERGVDTGPKEMTPLHRMDILRSRVVEELCERDPENKDEYLAKADIYLF